MYRWLQLDLVDHDLATAAGVRVRLSGCAFLIALALAVELSSLTIGVILSTALLIGPPATALLVTRRFSTAILLSVVLGVAATWLAVCSPMRATIGLVRTAIGRSASAS